MPYLILSAIGPEFPPEDNDIGSYFLRANSWSTQLLVYPYLHRTFLALLPRLAARGHARGTLRTGGDGLESTCSNGFRSTKPPGFRFHVLLSGGARKLRPERMAVG